MIARHMRSAAVESVERSYGQEAPDPRLHQGGVDGRADLAAEVARRDL